METAKTQKVYEVYQMARETVEVTGYGDRVLAFRRAHAALNALTCALEEQKAELRELARRIRTEYGAENVILASPAGDVHVRFTEGRKELPATLARQARASVLLTRMVETTEVLRGSAWTFLLDHAQIDGKPLREVAASLGFKVETKTWLVADFRNAVAAIDAVLGRDDRALTQALEAAGTLAPTVVAP